MQAINIQKVLEQTLEEKVSRFDAFFFKGDMPGDISSLSFDPKSLKDIMDNCSNYSVGLIQNSVAAPSTNKTLLSSSPLVLSAVPRSVLTGTGNDLSESNSSIVPQNWQTRNQFDATHKTLRFNGIPQAALLANAENQVPNATVGVTSSSIFINTGNLHTQDLEAVDYYYITSSQLADSLFITDTLFQYDQDQKELDNPGTYTGVPVLFSTSEIKNEFNQIVKILVYTSSLVAGGTVDITIQVIENTDLAEGISSPRYSPELVQDTGLGFRFHPIPFQTIPLQINGLSFDQQSTRAVFSKPGGLVVSYVYCSRIRFEGFNTISGLWEDLTGNIDIPNGNVQVEFVESVDQYRDMRIFCVYGPHPTPSYSLSSGSNTWTASQAFLYTKAPSPNYDIPTGDIKWAIVVPHNATSTLGSRVETTETYFESETTETLLLCDVGVIGSGTAIELVNVSLTNREEPVINKMELIFT